jgi:hypothetical protein
MQCAWTCGGGGGGGGKGEDVRAARTAIFGPVTM